MSTTCPSCGHQDFDPDKECICGYHADESFILGFEETQNEITRGKVMKNIDKSKIHERAEELIMKEIDSWVFSFSQVDNCIYLSTPALQSFRLKITLNDLEELLEFMYQKTDKEKSTGILLLSVDEIPDLIETVSRLIEEKKSKVKLKFSGDELKEIVDFINRKSRQ
jgi:hypothetical protein